ncbi:enoyl-CoA hydratase/isomerase family protein [Variovorax guangxiensis]|uniref:Enoyl-CoA hydratase/isomerase family protein n=1 Tax=Variovorax guangxiensis TaxID=1775474 RepID=A0A502DN48_9BURK|nr:enoyl-CoA hydratase/isomerase family protein [Variovorax guangxiensis]TPG22172.1 enoyl-CoA hydratase/isomerase family protein [Variovorax ginsengisoli]TPG26060.1 enoyl-CoA hydratase/isomerase family protein [Variovorax guangxiensis]
MLTPRPSERAAVVHYEVRQGVALLTLDGPPTNALSHAVRAGLLSSIYRAEDDADVHGIVVTGSARAFCAGGDIREFGTPAQKRSPRQIAIMEAIAACPKPVVAAISGACLGGGLELAMACHARVASADAVFGLPEIFLGLIPGGGGCQLLPRLLGMEAATEMILSGRRQPAQQLAGTLLLDRVVEGDAVPEAIMLTSALAASSAPLRRSLDLQVPEFNRQAWESDRQRWLDQSPGDPAARGCLDAIALAPVLPFREGQRGEFQILMALIASPESQARRHLFAAERRFAAMLSAGGGLNNDARLEAARIRLRSAAERASSGGDAMLQRAALANEGTRLLEESLLDHAAQVDLVCVHDLGFARLEGGAMFQADQKQLPVVVRSLQLQARRAPAADVAFWTPAELLCKLADAGGSLAEQAAPR